MKKLFGHGNIKTGDMARMCGGVLYGNPDAVINGICTDSREAAPGIAFLAIKGAKVDGHNYISTAEKTGASCVICQYIPEDRPGIPMIVTDNPVDALGRLAVAASADTKAMRIGVTGSVGKTTTKEFIAAALSERKVYRSSGNSNSVIGMPMSLTEMPADAEFGVFECGMERKNEMNRISGVCRPHIAVITNIGSSHLEYFDSRQGLAEWKLRVADCLDSDGTLLLSAEEPLFADRLREDPRAKSFSTDESVKADFMLKSPERTGEGMSFCVSCPGFDIENIYIPVIGRHNLAAALIAVAVAVCAGLEPEEIKRGLASYKPMAMRQEKENIGGVNVIADCYNASPESMKAACDMLCDTAGKSRKIAVLGDMYELGSQSVDMHFDCGRYFALHGLDALIAFGPSAGYIANGALTAMDGCSIYRFPDIKNPEAAAEKLSQIAGDGDFVIVKASRGVAAERIIDAFAKIKNPV